MAMEKQKIITGEYSQLPKQYGKESGSSEFDEHFPIYLIPVILIAIVVVVALIGQQYSRGQSTGNMLSTVDVGDVATISFTDSKSLESVVIDGKVFNIASYDLNIKSVELLSKGFKPLAEGQVFYKVDDLLTSTSQLNIYYKNGYEDFVTDFKNSN